jgi:hypothetical protein
MHAPWNLLLSVGCISLWKSIIRYISLRVWRSIIGWISPWRSSTFFSTADIFEILASGFLQTEQCRFGNFPATIWQHVIAYLQDDGCANKVFESTLCVWVGGGVGIVFMNWRYIESVRFQWFCDFRLENRGLLVSINASTHNLLHPSFRYIP